MHIKIVKRLINFYDIDGYIIPKNDEYFFQYFPLEVLQQILMPYYPSSRPDKIYSLRMRR